MRNKTVTAVPKQIPKMKLDEQELEMVFMQM